MFHVFTGWKISVEVADAGGAYIIVPRTQVVELSCLLAQHGIPHAVEGDVPTRHHADNPSEPVVRLGLAVEAQRVQDLLDREP